jgi:hypothetical protein
MLLIFMKFFWYPATGVAAAAGGISKNGWSGAPKYIFVGISKPVSTTSGYH